MRRGATDLCLEHSREIIYILEADVERDVSDGCVRRYQKHFRALRSDEGERQGYATTRVVAVENDGRRLIVSRFLTGDPRDRERSGL